MAMGNRKQRMVQVSNSTKCGHDWKLVKNFHQCEKCHIYAYLKPSNRYAAKSKTIKIYKPFKCSNSKCKDGAFVFLGKDGGGNKVFSCGNKEHSDLLQGRVYIETEN